MSALAGHLALLPILIPLVAGAAMIPLQDQARRTKAAIGLSSAFALVIVAVLLALRVDAAADGKAVVEIYRLGDWPTMFGIVLVADRLAATMVLLTALLGAASLMFAQVRWRRAGAHFDALFQFQLMGLNGAFLTGDLFNLFVFFEVLLAASYGLALHGSGVARVRAGLHYIAINLVASLLFLIGVALIYGVGGTLGMAELAVRVPLLPAADRPLLEAGAAILAIAFLVKAAAWPMGFWLVPTYAAASPPAAAILSIMSKVGIYALLRLSPLLFGDTAGASAGFGDTWLLGAGLLTIAFGAVSALATQDLPRLAGACVLISSGTLLAAIGIREAAVTGAALYYLVGSVLASGALFLLIELLERGREVGADVLAVTMEAFGEGEEEEEPPEDMEVVIPAALAILGLCFLACALVLSGLPPLSGFIGKFAMLAAALDPGGLGAGGTPPASGWALLAVLLTGGFATILAMMRAGIRNLWAERDREVPRIGVIEIAPVALLLGLTVVLTIAAGPAMRFLDDASQALHQPAGYLGAVLTSAAGR